MHSPRWAAGTWTLCNSLEGTVVTWDATADRWRRHRPTGEIARVASSWTTGCCTWGRAQSGRSRRTGRPRRGRGRPGRRPAPTTRQRDLRRGCGAGDGVGRTAARFQHQIRPPGGHGRGRRSPGLRGCEGAPSPASGTTVDTTVAVAPPGLVPATAAVARASVIPLSVEVTDLFRGGPGRRPPYPSA